MKHTYRHASPHVYLQPSDRLTCLQLYGTQMHQAGYTQDYIDLMNLSTELGSQVQQQLSIKLMHFDDKKGRPSQVVSHLALAAYKNGADYFYQVNDDTVFKSNGKSG